MKLSTSVLRSALVLACVGLLGGMATATTFTHSGYFNHPGNASLAASDLDAAQSGDDWEIVGKVALQTERGLQ